MLPASRTYLFDKPVDSVLLMDREAVSGWIRLASNTVSCSAPYIDSLETVKNKRTLRSRKGIFSGQLPSQRLL